MLIDLHIHSRYAPNGKLPMREIFELAKSRNIGCMAFTDSYCIAGMQEAFELGGQYGIKVVRGVEMQADSRVHLLAYRFDEGNAAFIDVLKASRQWVDNERIHKVMQNMKDKYSLGITLEEICALENTKSPSTKQVCNALAARDYAVDWKDAKARYFSPDSPNGSCYVGAKYSAKELVGFAKQANALVVLAHPHQIEKKEVDLGRLMPNLICAGLDGIEVHYNNQFMDEEKRQNAFRIKEKYNLRIVSGGSDFEGRVVTCLGGNPPVTSDMVSEELLEE